jgi:hypothetical protein
MGPDELVAGETTRPEPMLSIGDAAAVHARRERDWQRRKSQRLGTTLLDAARAARRSSPAERRAADAINAVMQTEGHDVGLDDDGHAVYCGCLADSWDTATDERGRPTLVDVHGRPVVSGKLATRPTTDEIRAAVAFVEREAEALRRERASQRSTTAPLEPDAPVAVAPQTRPRERRDGGRRSSSRGGDGGDSEPSEPEPEPLAAKAAA